MSTYRLGKMLAPRSVAVIGASPRKGSLGRAVLHNLRQGGFAGPIHLVNSPRRDLRIAVCAEDQRPRRCP